MATKKATSTKDAKKVQKEVKRGKVKEIDLDEDEFEEIEEVEEVLEDEDFDLEDEIEEIDEEDEFRQLTIEDKIEAVEKRTKWILGLVIVSLVIGLITMIATFTNLNGNTTSPTETPSGNESTGGGEDYTYDTSLFKEIKMSDIEAKSKGKEIVVFIGRQGCYWCSLYAPVIGQSAKENKYDVYYVDFGKIVDYNAGSITDENGYNLLNDYVKKSANFSTALDEGIGTPMTMFIKNNKLVNYIGGYVDNENLNTYLKKEGFIK